MGINYKELREILERKANKAIKHLDELKCFVPEFREVLDSVLYISETLQDLTFLDTECPDCKKNEEKQPQSNGNSLDHLLGQPYESFEGLHESPNRLVLFYSDHCQPCQYLKPILEHYALEHGYILEKVLVDQEAGVKHATRYGIQGWPTVFVIVDNTIRHTMTGADMNAPVERTVARLEQELGLFF